MKTLKFGSKQIQPILDGKINETWRINDEKNISVDDEIEFVDKRSGKAFGRGIVNQVNILRYGDIDGEDEEIIQTLQKYYGKSIDPKIHVKFITFSFTPYKGLRELAEGNYDVYLPELKVFADGGSRGNPGPSASGYAILDMDNNVVKKSGIYLGITTNNQAEYRSLKLGLEEAKKFKAEVVHVYMDSLLVINQMNGVYKVKNRELWPIHESVRQLAASFKEITYTHIPRELNKLADGEVNETLDAALKGGK